MKGVSRWTITILCSGVLLFGTLPAWGQGENPPADTAESGATSGHGMTLVEQTYKQAVDEQIRTLHEERWQAALKNDSGFFNKELAAQYFGVAPDGQLRTKDETVESFKSGTIKYQSVDERDVTVSTYGNAAIVSSLASINAVFQGKPVTGDFRMTFVYVKEQGIWREVAFGLAPMTKQS